MQTNHHLPTEILTEIFTRIPAKSVGKFKCLSKIWYAILSTSHFVKLHLSRNTHLQSLLFLKNGISVHIPVKSLIVMKLPIENPTTLKELNLENTWTVVLGSCNGIVLLLNTLKEMFLVNPTTLEKFKVPDLTFEKHPSNILGRYGYDTFFRGFGYDTCTDDYKIVVISRLSYYGDASSDDDMYSSDNESNDDTLVDLYSVKSGVWRRINHSLGWFSPVGSYSGAFVNGSINWFVNQQKSGNSLGIFALILATEVFYEVSIPLTFSKTLCRVFAHEGNLCAFNIYWTTNHVSDNLNKHFDVWMMQEYGMTSSWTKLGSVVRDVKWYLHEALYFSREDGTVLVTDGQDAVVVCNLQQGTVTDMVFDGVPAYIRGGFSFVDSLVSLRDYLS